MLQPSPEHPSTSRRVLLVVGVVAVVVVCAWQLEKLFRGGLNAPLDFAEYWTAGNLNANGENPYSGANVRAVQRGLGLDNTAIMMWNPPWALTLVMPVGLLPFRSAYGVWVLVNLALVVASVELLWRSFGGSPARRWIAHLLALTFTPTIFLIGSGQITAVVLFGLAGFLYYARTNRPLAAGAFAALTAVKPHLLALFALWLIFEATRSAFGRKIILGGLLVGAIACVPPTLANSEVWTQYWEAAHGPSSADHHHVSDWTPPVLGWWLRQFVPGKPFAMQWLPLAIGVVAFAGWWVANRGSSPQWAERLPWVVGFSLIVAPYGAWQFDLVLLLAPVLATAACVARSPNATAVVVGVALLASVNAVSLVMMVNQVTSAQYVWVTPLVLLGSAVVTRLAEPRSVVTPSPLGV